MALIDSSSSASIDHNEEVSRLYKRHHQQLVRHIVAKGLPLREAEEVVQEAFVKLLGLDDQKVQSYIRAYLYKIATNLAIDKLRRAARSPECQEPGLELADAADPTDSPEQSSHNQQLLRKLSVLLEDLQPKCRQAFLLYKVNGLDYDVIAGQLGVSPSMVRKYVLQAVRYCYDKLQDQL
ncbi:RNA polymerase sigma factor [Bowmanella sp. Y26]|uniref:RNA polymerase sigma factor n=1 Tax=Bowmanella yangjiangensis TaxID=2811230 RepID=UPI001BDCD01C|nr:RNA polymerase sigma factor [Bowmanella yangjiangensis]MBT1064592.1 RNA polymerase sigma factor [Bowmanella yangjiangensis]